MRIDENCDIQYKPQMAIYTWTVSDDYLIKVLDIVPLKDRTHGIDVKERIMGVFVKANLPISKLTAIAMDGTVNGLLGLCKANQFFGEFPLHHPQEVGQ